LLDRKDDTPKLSSHAYSYTRGQTPSLSTLSSDTDNRDDELLNFDGGYPLPRHGDVVGSIRVSGGQAEHEFEVAESGVEGIDGTAD